MLRLARLAVPDEIIFLVINILSRLYWLHTFKRQISCTWLHVTK